MVMTMKMDNADGGYKKKKKDLLSVPLARFTRCFRERGHKIHVVKKKRRNG